MIWAGLLRLSRPLWQLAILGLYQLAVHAIWQNAVLAIGAAFFIASNIALASGIDHPRWPSVLRLTLCLEATVSVVLSLVVLHEWVLGPACLLILPSLVTYAWMFNADRFQWLIAGFTAFILLFTLDSVVAKGSFDTPSAMQPQLHFLLLALYTAVLCLGAFLAFLLQRQRQEGDRMTETLARVESQAAQLGRANAQVRDYANQVYELATAEERNRIAGEIHDTVAHRLTALLVQLQAARRILGHTGDTDTVSENLQVCEALARESLDEVRRSVRSIRRFADLDSLDVLRRLAEHYARLTGMEISFQFDPGVGTVPAQVIAVLYRIVQEGLTNAQRHGRASKVALGLHREGSAIELEVSDNGRGAAGPAPGFGISSMHDRVRQLGGDIDIVTNPGQGFMLRVKLPVWEGLA